MDQDEEQKWTEYWERCGHLSFWWVLKVTVWGAVSGHCPLVQSPKQRSSDYEDHLWSGDPSLVCPLWILHTALGMPHSALSPEQMPRSVINRSGDLSDRSVTTQKTEGNQQTLFGLNCIILVWRYFRLLSWKGSSLLEGAQSFLSCFKNLQRK